MLKRIIRPFCEKAWVIREQTIEDPVSGLTLQFKVMPEGDSRLRIFGNLPFGNREFIFDRSGQEPGAGTALGSCEHAVREAVGP